MIIFPVVSWACWQLMLLINAPDTRVNETIAYGWLVLTGASFPDDQYYVYQGQGVARPELGFQAGYALQADGFDVVSLTFPVSAAITFQGERHEAQTGLEFTTDTPGAYVFEIEPEFPYKPTTVTIDAV